MAVDSTNISKSITGSSHSGYYVDDLDRTIEFYTKVLGARLAWRNEAGSRTPLIKLYVGDFGLSIIKRPENEPKREIEHAIHLAFRVDWKTAEEAVEYIKSCGVAVEGPVGHKREVGIVNWFFQDPDGFRLEVEAKYPTGEQSTAVIERGKATRNEKLGLYGGDAAKKKMGV
jgi:catechol 2,3-dioxygenase-like lactoylglutathione lyase family enzyme